ncbi:MAG: glycosyltransferase [Bryobacteraceae bacterium]
MKTHEGAGSGDSFSKVRIALAIVLFLTTPLAWSAIVVPLPATYQAAAAATLIAASVAGSFSPAARPFIIFVSCFASVRYCYWRFSSSINFDSRLDLAVSLLLLAAETYGLLILFLGYFQTLHVADRQALLKSLPAVDVFIPTYNEPVDVIRRTLIGALWMDYPNKRVYVLDDGARPQIEEMVASIGGQYIKRTDNRGAKAGNLNNALALTSGDFVAIFDADHVPVRGFLRKLMGFFEDQNVAFVQGAQHFFNPDPYEYNLNLSGRVAPEQTFFYQVVQPGNDFWNSAFFCGSCAILRRSALESIGGFRTETVTEDAHTAMELHARGFRSVYAATPLAAGLATESFAAHVQQRMRWARGMAQILRTDCPVFKKGLTLPQRLNYFNAMVHFFFGFPRLVLVTVPLTFLFFGIHPMKADALEVMAYVFPHVALSTVANSMISRRYRHSFLAAVYEISIAPYTAYVTLAALINPKAGKFQVTDKGRNADGVTFEWRNTRVILVLLALNFLALTVALPIHLAWYWTHGIETTTLDSILLNGGWTLINFIALLAAACVGIEQPQQRRSPRVARKFSCSIWSQSDQEAIMASTIDISETGVRIGLDRPVPLPYNCNIAIHGESGGGTAVEARRVRYDWGTSGTVEAAFEFSNLTLDQTRQLVQLIFCGDDSWVRQTYPEDRLLPSLWNLVTIPWRATRPRQAVAPESPMIRGHWPASFGDTECLCKAISGCSAVVELPVTADPGGGEFRVVLDAQRVLAVSQAVLRHRASRLCEIEFRWAGKSEERAFWKELYSDRPRPGRRVQPVVVVQPIEEFK